MKQCFICDRALELVVSQSGLYDYYHKGGAFDVFINYILYWTSNIILGVKYTILELQYHIRCQINYIRPPISYLTSDMISESIIIEPST